MATVLLLGLFGGNDQVYGQGQLPVANQRTALVPLPASPEAATLGSYGHIPVNESTGTPQIQVPFFTYQAGQLELPIGLSYLSTGLQVDQRASDTGLGWVLNAGGVISLTVNGLPDFSTYGYFRDPNRPTLYDSRRGGIVQPDINGTAKQRAAYEYYRRVVSGEADTEPDVYAYNFAGQTGRIVFDSLGTAQFLPFRPWRFEFLPAVNQAIAGFVITDEHGTRYEFGSNDGTLQEITTARRNDSCIVSAAVTASDFRVTEYTSAYYLGRVTNSQGDEVRFRYETVRTRYRTAADITRWVLKAIDVSSGTGMTCPIYTSNNLCFSTMSHESKRLVAIESATGPTARFEYDPVGREDLIGANRLRRVRLELDGRQLREFTLYHSYYRTGGPPAGASAWVTSDHCRLRLDSLQETGRPAYQFSYFAPARVSFPSIGSYSQDLWGYYNAQPNRTLLLTAANGGRATANRLVDTVAVKVGLLTRIRYPTGGTTDFNYESNEAANANFSFAEEIDLGALALIATDSRPQRDTVVTFQLDRPTVVRVAYTFSPNASSLTTYQALIGSRMEADGRRTEVFRAQPGNASDPGIHQLSLPAGTYHWYGANQYQAEYDADGNLRYDRVETGCQITYDRHTYSNFVGGCRIRRLRHNGQTPFGTAQVQTYEYRIPGQTISSGQLLANPILDYIKQNRYVRLSTHPNSSLGEVYTDSCTCTYNVSLQNAVNMANSTVAYEHVAVIQHGKGEQLRTESAYSIRPDAERVDAPFAPTTSYDFMRGQLLRRRIYRQTANGYILVKRESYRYDTGAAADMGYAPRTPFAPNEVVLPALRVYQRRTADGGGGVNAQFLNEYSSQLYFYISAWTRMLEAREVMFGYTGDSTVRVTRNIYANPGHAQLTHKFVNTSGGDTMVTQWRYPLDVAPPSVSAIDGAGAAVKELALTHNLTPVVETITSRRRADGTIRPLDALLNRYAIVGSRVLLKESSKLQVPVGTAFTSVRLNPAWNADPRYLSQVRYEAFDGTDPAEAVTQNASREAYLWGYRTRELLSKVLNATAERIAYTSFEPEASGKWVYAVSGVQTGGLTGKWSYRLSNNHVITRPQLPAGNYHLSFWATAPPQVMAGTTSVSVSPPVASKPNGWHLYRLTFALSSTADVVIRGSAAERIDELRLHPSDAQMTTYTYEPLVGMTSQTDPSGRTIIYEYDSLGRLLRVRDEHDRILKEQEYKYVYRP